MCQIKKYTRHFTNRYNVWYWTGYWFDPTSCKCYFGDNYIKVARAFDEMESLTKKKPNVKKMLLFSYLTKKIHICINVQRKRSERRYTKLLMVVTSA